MLQKLDANDTAVIQTDKNICFYGASIDSSGEGRKHMIHKMKKQMYTILATMSIIKKNERYRGREIVV